MAPHMDAILQVLRTHLFAKSNNSTEHDVELGGPRRARLRAVRPRVRADVDAETFWVSVCRHGVQPFGGVLMCIRSHRRSAAPAPHAWACIRGASVVQLSTDNTRRQLYSTSRRARVAAAARLYEVSPGAFAPEPEEPQHLRRLSLAEQRGVGHGLIDTI